MVTEQKIAKGRKAYRGIVNQEIRLSQSADPKMSATYKKQSDHLGKGSSEPPLLFAE